MAPATPRLPELISALTQTQGPALIFYGDHRIELGGTVVSRWLAKMANLLENELSPALLGDDRPGVLHLALPTSWQAVLWFIAARGLGWKVAYSSDADISTKKTLDSDAFREVDVLVTHSVPIAQRLGGTQTYAWVLLQDLSPMAFRWDNAPLPEDFSDALSDLMSQPDGLVIDTPQSFLLDPKEEAAHAKDIVLLDTKGVAFIATGIEAVASQCVKNWFSAKPAVVFDPTYHDEASQQRCLTAEKLIPQL